MPAVKVCYLLLVVFVSGLVILLVTVVCQLVSMCMVGVLLQQSVCLSACLSVCLFVSLLVCLSVVFIKSIVLFRICV